MPKGVRIALVLVLLGAAAGGYFWWRSRNGGTNGAVYGIVESRRVEAGSRVGGRVLEVLAEEGDVVEKGAVIVRLDMAEIEARRDQTKARIAEAQAHLEMLARGLRPEEIKQADAASLQAKAQYEALRNGPRAEEIEQARADLRASDADLVNAESTYRRLEKLHTSGDISARAFDDASARRDAAKARREASAQRVKLLETGTRAEDIEAARQRLVQTENSARVAHLGTRSEEIAQARARVEQARADLAQLEIQLAEGRIVALNRARIETIAVRPGDLATPNRALVTLLEADQTKVRAYVPEIELAQWRVGQGVEVALDDQPGRWLDAVVEQIAAQAEFMPRNVQTRDDRSRQVFAVKVRLTGNAELLKSGMAAAVRRKQS